ncbi:MAG: sigma-70 family RNA polymerase sigma factor [Acidobacteria bacterium]|nr:sigma-70 family RNA polymerase sigma factor [Acidobacteriota bacterium]
MRERPRENQDDEELAALLRAGHPEAFAKLVERHSNRIYWLVRRMVGAEQAEDLTQDVFLRAYQALPRFRGECRFSTWLCRIARNRCLTEIAKRSRPCEPLPIERDTEDLECSLLPQAAPDLEQEIERQDLSRIVRACLDSLPERFRTLLTLHYLNGMRYEEIAGITDLPLGTVKAYIHRARLRLRELVLQETGIGAVTRP